MMLLDFYHGAEYVHLAARVQIQRGRLFISARQSTARTSVFDCAACAA
jgi:hypothetical protein